MLQKCLTVSRYTLVELLKSKILYVTLGIGVAIVAVTFVATEFTYGVPQKVALDFGLGMLSLSSFGIALFMGATLLPNEIDSRTVYMVISRPVPRWVFISGKILGLTGVLVINIGFLSLMSLGVVSVLGGAIDEVMVLAILFNILESLLLLLLVVFFSLFSNAVLSSTVSLVLLLLGHAVKETQQVLFVENRPLLRTLLEIYHLVLPGFYKLNLKDFVIYNQTIPGAYVLQAFAYGVAYSLCLFLLILFIFNRKNLD
jgi:ABC-type transport system involved in multi-copper enzyme maturation permease subunit